MNKLSTEGKIAIVKKALNHNGETIKQIAQTYNVGYSTLQKWLKSYREGNPVDTKKSSTNSVFSNSLAEKLEHVIATANLAENDLGAYCRQHGFYSHQLKEWREDFMTDKSKLSENKSRDELKKYKAENKQLKKELLRKDKALAETSALLILKKKADLIWGELEDD